MLGNGNNGDRIGGFKKVDILFVVGVGMIVYGAVIRRLDLIVAGTGIAGIPLAQRGDRG